MNTTSGLGIQMHSGDESKPIGSVSSHRPTAFPDSSHEILPINPLPDVKYVPIEETLSSFNATEFLTGGEGKQA